MGGTVQGELSWVYWYVPKFERRYLSWLVIAELAYIGDFYTWQRSFVPATLGSRYALDTISVDIAPRGVLCLEECC